MRVVVALGGNALLKRGEPMTAENQRVNVRSAAPALAAVAKEHQLVLSHGNGPQVGLLALQAAAYTDVEPYPLDILGAQTEGMIGYVLEQELGNVMPSDTPLATILTMVDVDPEDPAFGDPTKFVGPIYTKAEADVLTDAKSWVFKPDGDSWRRVVPSPEPRQHPRDPSDPLAPGPGRRPHLCGRWGGADDVPAVRERADPGRGRGGHRQGPGQPAVGQGRRRRPVRHGHGRRRGVRRLGDAAAAPRSARSPSGSSGSSSSRPARWVRRSMRPVASWRRPVGAPRSGR